MRVCKFMFPAYLLLRIRLTYPDYHVVQSVQPIAPPIYPTIYHSHSLDCLDINHKFLVVLLPRTAISQCTICDFQISVTNQNISSRLKIEVRALSPHSSINIYHRQSQTPVLKTKGGHNHIVCLCPCPTSPSGPI